MATQISACLLLAVICITASQSVLGQRPPFAGQRSNGYHDRLLNTNNPMPDRSVVPLDNRFGGSPITTSGRSDIPPERLPTAAIGDPTIVNTLNQRPIEQRPFWLINYEAIEAQKNTGPPGPTPSAFGGSALTNRFAADDNNNNGPLFVPEDQQHNYQQMLGTAHDPGNYLLSPPEIVYPLPNDGPAAGGDDDVPVTVNANSKTSTVITLNGQPFLLTPLPVHAQQHGPPVFYFD